jgi:hypothetical protein
MQVSNRKISYPPVLCEYWLEDYSKLLKNGDGICVLLRAFDQTRTRIICLKPFKILQHAFFLGTLIAQLYPTTVSVERFCPRSVTVRHLKNPFSRVGVRRIGLSTALFEEVRNG